MARVGHGARALSAVASKVGSVGGAIAVLLWLGLSSGAQATGQTDFVTHCNGCHFGGPLPVNFNAVNSLGNTAVVDRAITANMLGGPPSAALTTALPGIVAYIASVLPAADPPAGSPVGFNAIATNFPLTTLLINSGYGGYTAMATVGLGPTKGTVTYDPTTTSINYTPGLNQCGADNWTYQATGPAGTSSLRTGRVTIASPTAPVATSNAPPAILYSTLPTNIPLSLSGTAPTGITITQQPAVGSVVATGTNTVSYTASTSAYLGTVTFQYQATGPCTTSAVATVTVTVGLPPAPSVAVPAGPFTTAFNTPAAAINLTANITGISTSITVMSNTNGIATVSGNSVTFTPTAGFIGTGSFTYRAIGPGGSSATSGAVNITVLPPPPTVSVPAGPFQTAFNTPAAAIDLTPNISGVSTSITVMSNTNGIATVSGNSVTFTPTAGFIGTGSFTYRANGPGGSSPTSGAVNITVLPPPPTVSVPAGPFQTAFNTPAAAIDLTPNISGVSTSITIMSNTNGIATVSGNSVTFTPTAGFFGTGSFTYRANGPGGSSATSGPVNITVLPPPPSVAARSVSVTYQLALPIDLTAQITGVSTSIAVVTPATNGTTSVIGNVVTYTPNALYLGADSFFYQATGPGGLSGTAKVTITVVPPAPPTAASPPPVTTAFNTQAAIDLSAQLGGVYLSVAVVTPPANGTIVSIVGNIITYRPNLGYVGADSFTYQAQGPGGTISVPPAAVNITVLPAAPLVSAPPTVTTAFNTPVAINLAAQISGSFTSIAIATPPAHGTAGVVGTTVNYTPTAGYSGADSFTYTATGAGGPSLPSPPVNINILPPPPTVAARAVAVGFSISTGIDLSAQITGVSTSIAVVTAPTKGTIVSVIGNVVTYLPNANYTGPDSFTYRATGPGGVSGIATVSITVTAAPPPVVANGAASTTYNKPVSIDLTPQISGFFSSIAIATPPANGSIVSVVGFVVTYAPKAGYIGSDSFTFTATGPGGTSLPATEALTVAAPPPPAAADSAVTVMFNAVSPINLSAQISGIVTNLAVVSAATHGTTSVTGNVVTYTPMAGYFGDDSFTYAVTGPGGTSAPAKVSITVSTLAPSAGAFKMIVPLNTSTTMDLAPFITGSAITGIVVVTAPKYGTAMVSGTKLTYTPIHDYFGNDSLSYAVFGNAGTSPAAMVTIVVVGRPDPTKDANVTGLLAAQSESAQRFSRAQIANFQGRMETLHRSGDSGSNGAGPAPGSPPVPIQAARPAPAPVAMPASGQPADNRAASVDSANKSSAFLPTSYAGPVPAGTTFPFASELGSLLTTRSLNVASLVAASTGDVAAGSPAAAGGIGAVNFWVSGVANFGKRVATGSRNQLDFTTDGVSFGADRRINGKLVAGVGVGFARDRTDIGGDGSKSRAQGASVAAYASYHPTANTFVDSLLGAGSLDFKTQRYVAPIDSFASGDRSGRQLFASLAAGYEFRDTGILLSPYARLDYASDRLNRSTESGAGQYALTYYAQTTPSLQGVVGLRTEALQQTSYGWATPRARVEYRREFQGDREATLAYADLVGGPRFAFTTSGLASNILMVGLGADFIRRGGLTIGLDYQLQHNFSKDSIQGIRLTFSQDLDALGSPSALRGFFSIPKKPEKIQVDAGFMFDTNVTRSRTDADKLYDRAYSVNAGKGFVFTFGDADNPRENLRAQVNVTLGGEKFQIYDGLSRAMAGVDGELQYRTSSNFDAVTFAVFGRASAEHYRSELRNGYRYSAGISARQSLTDRIDIFGSLSHNERIASSAVFTNRDNAARINLDYALSEREVLYATGEYRRGTTFSTGRPSLDNLDVADVFVADDAFPGGQYFAYRFDANTIISTLGYNLGFGPRHSLDISWRRAQSSPRQQSAASSGNSNYVTDQYSIIYLIRF